MLIFGMVVQFSVIQLQNIRDFFKSNGPHLRGTDVSWFKQYLFEKKFHTTNTMMTVNIGFDNKIINLMLSHLLVKYLNEHTDEVST